MTQIACQIVELRGIQPPQGSGSLYRQWGQELKCHCAGTWVLASLKCCTQSCLLSWKGE